MKIYTHFLPPVPSRFCDNDVAVVVDILRATTVMAAALKAGVTYIQACLEVHEAQELATATQNALLCGERQGLMPKGFDIGNSPGDYTAERCQGRPMVMTTTNGTRALIASSDAGVIYTLSFGNIKTVFDALIRQNSTLQLVCSGTDGLVSWEDTLACGMLADSLVKAGHEIGDDSTRIAVSLYENTLGWLSLETIGFQERLVDVLKKGRGGQRVCAIGLEKDLVEVARVNEFAILSEVVKNPLRVINSQLA